MSTISLRVPEEELNIFKSYAKHNNSTLSEIIRKTMLERIEDEYDLKVFADYEAEKKAGTLKTRPISELWKELDL
ncbi:MAG: antitoxin [Lachnospiraceae bacterium]|jgi:toxin-antitoxin system protein|uniref:Antitoxin n=1 Tax=Oribacterium sinus TaxID=237576 RepID=A0A930DXH9_9FIRM|nr:antitoxin [Lachnospiraceae bacterium]MBF1305097.1 antitoxin [Oribacterium sinus]MBF1001875.1 antitoxin [Lachnospiraceae bacterium]MBF1003666.1 antitoxin [Lachnospiraceae bacterium]MBF1012536.1 antitoxin [Lachnospiraceae bacterium]